MTIIIWSDYCRNSNCSIDERRSFFGKKSGRGGDLHPPEKARQAGHLQTGLKAAWWGPTPTESRRSKMAPKDYPCLRCKKNVGKVKAVQCATCKMWVHKECEEMSDELYNVLAGKYGGVMWQCQSCQASTARLEASLKEVEKRLNNVEASVSNVEERVKLVDAKVERAELVAEQAKKEAHSVKEDVTQAVYEEMRERDEKRLNILLHNVPEAGEATEEEARSWDEGSFNNIVGAMGLKLQFKECATFSRRLGQKGKDRPLLIGLKKEDDKAMILSGSSKLARSNFKEISVVPDLTKKQREMDDNTRKEAERKNREELTDEERSKNMRWVAVGKKGARKIVKKVWKEAGRSHPNGTSQQTRKRANEEPVQTQNTTKKQKGQEMEVEEVEEDEY